MAVPDEVYRLVEQFDRARDELRSIEYGETEVRVHYLNPLFRALGWDVLNERGRPLSDLEVIHEDAVRVSGSHKAPDYGFYAGRQLKFFVEAKRPSENIDQHAGHAFQLRRYAWSAKLPVSILTDFEEFAVYDGSVQPTRKDTAATARLRLIQYTDYIQDWNYISSTFSRDAVYGGSIDRLGGSLLTPQKQTVDRAFLTEIERWRELLARNLKLRHQELNREALNFAVQMTIDRIIFLRMAEDRGIEPYGRLRDLCLGENVYSRLREIFRLADERYNSGLFHFQPERDREPPDTLTPRLSPDDATLKSILGSLYYPESPYEFSVLPVEVLGQVYEQFLGKVITFTSRGAVTIEEKPEVRKAGGVYYTPSHIVDYMVEHTLGKLLADRTPQGARRLRIVDPACGSGSFLIGAYEYLLSWYRDWFVNDGPEKHQHRIYQIVGRSLDDSYSVAEWRLSSSERRRILLDHIYGVDVDPQAVEVTKLSLLLRLLEGESDQTLNRQLHLLSERVLPDLDNNIKCGNSLVGTDVYSTGQLSFSDLGDARRINPFSWESEFEGIFERRNPGFDVVIGNPPYVDSEWMTQESPFLRDYCADHYSAASGNWDLYCVFIEKASQISRRGGLSSLIVKNTLASAEYAAETRKILANNNRLISIRDYSKVPVFPVAVYPIIYVASRSTDNRKVVSYEEMGVDESGTIRVLRANSLDYQQYFGESRRTWPIGTDKAQVDLFDRLKVGSTPLGDVADVTGAATVAEAYNLKPLICEELDDHADDLRITNSGTLDRFRCLWGIKNLRYLGESFLRPTVSGHREGEYSPRRIRQGRTPKVIVAGMTKSDRQ